MRQPNNKKGPEGMAKVNKDVVKRLMSYIGHYKLRFAAVLICIVVNALAMVSWLTVSADTDRQLYHTTASGSHTGLCTAVPFHFDHGMYLRSGNPCLPILQQNDGKYRTGNVKTYSRRDVRTYADTADPLF